MTTDTNGSKFESSLTREEVKTMLDTALASLGPAQREQLRSFVDEHFERKLRYIGRIAMWVGFPTLLAAAGSLLWVWFVLPGIAADKALKQWKIETKLVQDLYIEMARAQDQVSELKSKLERVSGDSATLDQTNKELNNQVTDLRHRFDALNHADEEKVSRIVREVNAHASASEFITEASTMSGRVAQMEEYMAGSKVVAKLKVSELAVVDSGNAERIGISIDSEHSEPTISISNKAGVKRTQFGLNQSGLPYFWMSPNGSPADGLNLGISGDNLPYLALSHREHVLFEAELIKDIAHAMVWPNIVLRNSKMNAFTILHVHDEPRLEMGVPGEKKYRLGIGLKEADNLPYLNFTDTTGQPRLTATVVKGTTDDNDHPVIRLSGSKKEKIRALDLGIDEDGCAELDMGIESEEVPRLRIGLTKEDLPFWFLSDGKKLRLSATLGDDDPRLLFTAANGKQKRIP